MSKQLLNIRQPEPKNILVESNPVEDGKKLVRKSLSWEDIRGLTWISAENEFD